MGSSVGWTAVLPVKRLTVAKSRLRGTLDDDRHQALALALALDTLEAVRACPDVLDVVVVTGDPAVAAAAVEVGARVVAEPAGSGLNAAIAAGAATALGSATAPGQATPLSSAATLSQATFPGPATASGPPTAVRPLRAAGPDRWMVALTADLPALRPAELSAALRAAARRPVRRFVADTPGTGTVLLTAPARRALDPRFGPGSAAAHAASGAVELPGDWPGLRRDVDTAEDLRAAGMLGLGRHTGRLLAAVGRSAV